MKAILWLMFLFPLMAFAQSNPTCGNGAQDVGERCDDGNLIDGDGCSSSCVPEFCGDKVVNKKGEECDDGNPIDGDGCNECRKSSAVSKDPSDESNSAAPLITPEEAFRRSLVTTLFLPPGLGLVYGPSIGHFAAGETGRGFGMSFLRAALVGGAIGITSAMGNGKLDPGPGFIILSLDGLLLTTLVAVDLLDGPRAVARQLSKGK